VPFPSIYEYPTCAQHVLPYSSFDVNALPAVSFIAPNICDDQHGTSNTQFTNCIGNSTALVQRGDNWLAARVPAMLAAGARVFITYDESNTMYAAYSEGSGLIDTPVNHYSLLRGIENDNGLLCLQAACSATPIQL
jgi:hypothetical protein